MKQVCSSISRAAVYCVAACAAVLAQVPSQTAATTLIPVTALVTLPTPTNDLSTNNTLQQLLSVTRAHAGFEEALRPADPVIDLAHPPLDSLKLTGSLSSALDAVVAHSPHFRWAENDGFVVVRGGPATHGFLDQPLPTFSVTDVSPARALAELVTTLDPSRRGEDFLGHQATPEVMAAMAPALRSHHVTLVVPNPTVLNVLNAIARTGNVSWAVRYDGNEATADTATISLRAADMSATAYSPAWRRAQAPAGTPSIHIPLENDLGQMLASYARTAHVRLGVELLPATRGAFGFIPGVTLDLTNVAPSDAIQRIVAYDSRYELSRDGNIFHVSPKPSVDGRVVLLDKSVPSFSASSEGLASVLGRVVWLTGFQPEGSPSVDVGRPPSSAGWAERRQRIQQTPVTMSLSRPGTPRDVLDQLCAALESASWELRIDGSRAQLRVSSVDGWSILQPIALPVAASRPIRRPDVAIPEALDHDIGQVATTFVASGPFSPIGEFLGMTAASPMGFEQWPEARNPPATDARIVMPQPPRITLGPGKFSDALYVLLEHDPTYSLTVNAGVIDIAPIRLRDDPRDFLNTKVDHFDVHDVTVKDGVVTLRHQLDPRYPEKLGGSGGSVAGSSLDDIQRREAAAREVFDRKISFTADHESVRQILDGLVAANGQTRWSVRYDSLDPSMAAEPVFENAVILIGTFHDIGIATQFDPIRPAGARFIAPPIAPRRPNASSLTVVLPVNPRGLDQALSGFASRSRTRVSWEFIQPPQTSQERQAEMALTTGAARYDLGGLPIGEALDRILEGVPGYQWMKVGDSYRVLPKIVAAAPSTLLGKRVGDIDQHFWSVDDAMTFACEQINPSYKPPVRRGVPPDRVRALTERPIAVKLTNATVRDLLDEIARQHGGMTWSAEYAAAPEAVDQFQLTAHGFDGWSTAVRVPIR